MKNAPDVTVDDRGHLSEREEHRLYDYYGIDWDAAWQRADKQSAQGQQSQKGMAAAAGSGTATKNTPAAGAGTAKTGAPAKGRTAAGDDAMIRSEERMHVGTERRESGHARLRKYVVTDEQEQTVPVRHEEVRVEREPITDADRGTAMSGTEISEETREVTLHEEHPVTEIETVPVERVRLTTEEVTEEKTVRGDVRKEKIDTETDMESDH